MHTDKGLGRYSALLLASVAIVSMCNVSTLAQKSTAESIGEQDGDAERSAQAILVTGTRIQGIQPTGWADEG